MHLIPARNKNVALSWGSKSQAFQPIKGPEDGQATSISKPINHSCCEKLPWVCSRSLLNLDGSKTQSKTSRVSLSIDWKQWNRFRGHAPQITCHRKVNALNLPSSFRSIPSRAPQPKKIKLLGSLEAKPWQTAHSCLHPTGFQTRPECEKSHPKS